MPEAHLVEHLENQVVDLLVGLRPGKVDAPHQQVALQAQLAVETVAVEKGDGAARVLGQVVAKDLARPDKRALHVVLDQAKTVTADDQLTRQRHEMGPLGFRQGVQSFPFGPAAHVLERLQGFLVDETVLLEQGFVG